MQWYNGFSDKERRASGHWVSAGIRKGEIPRKGRCALCGEHSDALDYHAEDYSEPYCWKPPAMYPLCVHCHRHKLHRRFDRPDLWLAYKAHVRRGGYASEWTPSYLKECLKGAGGHGISPSVSLPFIREYEGRFGTDWWERLSCDPAVIEPGVPRPRRA